MVMKQAGFPDYARLTTQGGYELANVTGNVASGGTVFSGFVGIWAYLDILTTGFASPNFARYTITYYTDNSYTTQVGVIGFTRHHSQSSQCQYAVLGPWCKITVTTNDGTALTSTIINIYGTQGTAGRIRLGGSDGQLFSMSQSFPAGLNGPYLLGTCAPGPAYLAIHSLATSYFVELESYSFTGGTYNVFLTISNDFAPKGGIWQFALPDSPVEVLINNGQTTAQGMTVTVGSMAY